MPKMDAPGDTVFTPRLGEAGKGSDPCYTGKQGNRVPTGCQLIAPGEGHMQVYPFQR